MAININAPTRAGSIRIKYYDHKYLNEDTKLIPTLKVKGLFRGIRQPNAKKENYITSSGHKTKRETMILYTQDHVKDLEPDDFIIYKNEKWLVFLIDEVDRSGYSSFATWVGNNIYVRKWG